MTYTVTVDGLRKSFADHVVLHGVDLAVDAGTVCALLGANGAGKTTLVRILTTLLAPDAGHATVAGHDLLTDPDAVRRAISLTGQSAAVDEILTARENLTMVARLRHLAPAHAARRVTQLLAEFDLTSVADRRAGTYSGGMKRRLNLAIGLLDDPVVMFLDEPTTGLDPRSREQLWGAVRDIVARGVTVLLTTQYLEEADQLADSVAVLDGGRIVARGTPEELKAGLGAEVIRLQFTEQRHFELAAALLAAERSDPRLRTVEVTSDGSASEVSRILDRLQRAGAPADRVSTHRPGLDDVFFALTSGTTLTGRDS